MNLEQIFEAIVSYNKMIKMEFINSKLRNYTPEYIIKLTNHGQFNLSDDYFCFENEDKIVSVNSVYLKKMIKEKIIDKNMEINKI